MSSVEKKKSKKNSTEEVEPIKNKKEERKEKKDKKESKKDKKSKVYNKDDDIEYIVCNVEHLSYKNRLDILKMVHDSSYKDHITESSDGSRIDAENMPDELVSEIRKFVQARMEVIDITATF